MLVSKVGEDGVTSTMAGPATTLSSVTFPESSDVKKTYPWPSMPAGTVAEKESPFIVTGTGIDMSPLQKVAKTVPVTAFAGLRLITVSRAVGIPVVIVSPGRAMTGSLALLSGQETINAEAML